MIVALGFVACKPRIQLPLPTVFDYTMADNPMRRPSIMQTRLCETPLDKVWPSLTLNQNFFATRGITQFIHDCNKLTHRHPRTLSRTNSLLTLDNGGIISAFAVPARGIGLPK